MITLRPAAERGRSQLSWLDSYHTFSFDQYFDPQHTSFGPLRVINEDTIAAGGGFGSHPHRDMEIITYVIEGELKHQDSLGNGSIIRPGEIQKMSAGSGIIHSEFNASDKNPVHLLQIWIIPDERNLKPGYEQQKIDFTSGQLILLGSPDGAGLVSIHQNVYLYGLRASGGTTVTHTPRPGAQFWVQVARGQCDVNGQVINAGDGAAIKSIESGTLAIRANDDTELLLFEILAK